VADRKGARAPIIAVYALAKTGKTFDAGRFCAAGVAFTPASDNLAPVLDATGVMPDVVEVSSVSALSKRLEKLLESGAKPPVILIDDFDVMADFEAEVLNPDNSRGKRGHLLLHYKIKRMRNLLIQLNVPTVVTTGLVEPGRRDDGSEWLGGPAMPTKPMAQYMVRLASLLVRGEREGMVDPPEWPGRYVCSPGDSDWMMGDRWGVLPWGEPVPMSLRQIVAYAVEKGHNLLLPPRPSGTEWVGELARAVEEIRQKKPNAPMKALGRWAAKKSKWAGKDPRLLRWGVQDGWARYELRRAPNALDDFR